MKKKNKRYFMIIMILALAGVLYVAVLQAKIVKYSNIQPPPNADYLIVLGAKVNGTIPSLVLNERIQSAAMYLEKNKNTIAIASGGRGPGEDISEAEAIKRGLIKLGIDEKRILLENRSTDTYENIRYSKKVIDKKAKLGIIATNDFHLYRAMNIAKDYQLSVSGLPAKTPTIAIFKGYAREYLAITKYYLKSIGSLFH